MNIFPLAYIRTAPAEKASRLKIHQTTIETTDGQATESTKENSSANGLLLADNRRLYTRNLELNHLSLPLLVSSKLEMLAALQGDLLTELAFGTFHPQHDLFGRLGLHWNEARRETVSNLVDQQLID